MTTILIKGTDLVGLCISAVIHKANSSLPIICESPKVPAKYFDQIGVKDLSQFANLLIIEEGAIPVNYDVNTNIATVSNPEKPWQIPPCLGYPNVDIWHKTFAQMNPTNELIRAYERGIVDVLKKYLFDKTLDKKMFNPERIAEVKKKFGQNAYSKVRSRSDLDKLNATFVRTEQIQGGSGSAANSQDYPSIEREYQRWYVTKKSIDNMQRQLRHPKLMYEARNVLERWLTTIPTSIKLHGEPGMALEDLSVTKKMYSEFADVANGKAGQFVPRHLGKMASFADFAIRAYREFFEMTEFEPDGIPTIKENGNIIEVRYKEFFDNDVSKERFHILSHYGNITQIATLIMRYRSIATGAQQWNVPYTAYSRMIEEYGVNLEGFGSPLNSVLLKYMFYHPEYMGKLAFCSLFPDTDCLFGSLGSYFDNDLSSRIMSANTPYLPEILLDIVQHAIDGCNTDKETVLIMGFPYWHDADWYKLAQNNKYFITEILLEKAGHYFENSNKADEKVIAYFATSLIVLGNNLKRDYDWTTLQKMQGL
jgi:hypothetical protein